MWSYSWVWAGCGDARVGHISCVLLCNMARQWWSCSPSVSCVSYLCRAGLLLHSAVVSPHQVSPHWPPLPGHNAMSVWSCAQQSHHHNCSANHKEIGQASNDNNEVISSQWSVDIHNDPSCLLLRISSQLWWGDYVTTDTFPFLSAIIILHQW